jgi:acyl-[acyl-carrier-protein]-phospholipid O-acyltransferase / long-chain-fatty-acid--[acyl-carrier-protein] ligase
MRTASTLRLLGTRRFAPLFATQFLGAFNDNLYRSAMLFLLSFALYRGAPDKAALAAVASGGIFILPYFLFSSFAGQLADRIDKARLARLVKVAEIAIMLVGWAALATGSMPLLMLVLFAMGTHSTVFGPIKYAMLPQHLRADELMGGTGLVEAGTFLAILAGQLAGGLLPTPVATAALIAVALLGWITSLFIPPAPAGDDPPAVDPNLIRSSAAIVAHSWRNRALFLVIGGITWFFALGATLTQQFVPLVGALNGTQAVGALFLGLFSVGVAIGALLVARLLKGRISARAVPLSGALVGIAVLDLGWTVSRLVPAPAPVAIPDFLARPGSWHLVIDLLATAIAGGLFIVPLYALLQTLGEAGQRSRDVAANNLVNAAGMVATSLIVGVILSAGAGNGLLFAVLGIAGLAVAALLLPLRSVENPVKAGV